MNQDKVEKALEEEHDKLWGLRRRTSGTRPTSVQVWKDMAVTAEENWRDSVGTGDEDYWAMAMAVCRRRAQAEGAIEDLTERRFT